MYTYHVKYTKYLKFEYIHRKFKKNLGLKNDQTRNRHWEKM